MVILIVSSLGDLELVVGLGKNGGLSIAIF